MALSDDRLDELSREMVKGRKSVNWLAAMIEAEVRQDDEALIQQLVEALEGYRRNHNDGQPCDAEKAGRARLEKAP